MFQTVKTLAIRVGHYAGKTMSPESNLKVSVRIVRCVEAINAGDLDACKAIRQPLVDESVLSDIERATVYLMLFTPTKHGLWHLSIAANILRELSHEDPKDQELVSLEDMADEFNRGFEDELGLGERELICSVRVSVANVSG